MMLSSKIVWRMYLWTVKLFDIIDKSTIISYAKLIEAANTWTIFCIIGFGTIMLNLIGLQVNVFTNDEWSSEFTDKLRV